MATETVPGQRRQVRINSQLIGYLLIAPPMILGASTKDPTEQPGELREF